MFLNKRELYPFPNYMTIGNSVTCLRDHASEEICTSTLRAACLFMTIYIKIPPEVNDFRRGCKKVFYIFQKVFFK